MGVIFVISSRVSRELCFSAGKVRLRLVANARVKVPLPTKGQLNIA
jgi:hypothetical protein